MNRLKSIADKFSHVLTTKRCAILVGIIFVLTMIPIVYVAPAVRATGDDLGYSAGVHQALAGGEGLSGALTAIAKQVVGSWYSWQGTWSSIVLFCLQPGILGDEWYPLTVAVSLSCILCGTGYFLHVFLKRIGFHSAFRWIVFFLAAVMAIQYMPYPRGGIYWWTSVAHYDISYLAAMLVMGWSLRWFDTGKKRYFIGITLLMTYLGGAGYPALVLAAVWLFLMIVGGMTGLLPAGNGSCDVSDVRKMRGETGQQTQKRSTASKDDISAESSGDLADIMDAKSKNVSSSAVEMPDKSQVRSVQAENAHAHRVCFVRLRSSLLLMPLVLEMIGFVISAIAPGNSNRGGEGFGFSVSNVIYTLLTCVKEGFTEGVGYFLTARPLILVLIVIAFFAWETAPRMEVRDGKGRIRIEQPILAVLLGFGITCIVRAPEIYAASEVSGGVPDTYWFVTLTALAAVLSYACAWGRNAAASMRVEAAEVPSAAERGKSIAGDAASGTEPEAAAAINIAPEDDDRAGASLGSDVSSTASEETLQRKVCWSPVVLLAAGLLCLLLSRYMIGATVDYTIYNFVSGGAYEDYQIQMSEWLEILNDPEITDAVLPAMNDEQGPFMLMVPTDNPDDVTSADYRNYYGKNSVIMVTE